MAVMTKAGPPSPLELLKRVGLGILQHPSVPFSWSPTWPFKALFGLITFVWPWGPYKALIGPYGPL